MGTAPALAATAARADGVLDWLTVRLGHPDDDGWLRCDDLDPGLVLAWEREVADRHRAEYGRSDPMAAAGYVLDWCAGVPGLLGGAFFALARRVPRLDPRSLALHRHGTERHPDGYALLDERFWCLPDDPAAADPAATVLPGDAALAGVLRAQVRAHADAFLSGYRPGARLPRRHLLGAFLDGLDTGMWIGAVHRGALPDAVVADAAAVLPGRTPQFRDASTLHPLTDDRGRTHLSRTRISCCCRYRLDPAGAACVTCPRTTPAERRRRTVADQA